MPERMSGYMSGYIIINMSGYIIINMSGYIIIDMSGYIIINMSGYIIIDMSGYTITLHLYLVTCLDTRCCLPLRSPCLICSGQPGLEAWCGVFNDDLCVRCVSCRVVFVSCLAVPCRVMPCRAV